MTMKLHHYLIAGALASALVLLENGVLAQGTAFTYQGALDSGGSPAEGLYDFIFSLYDAAVDGTQQGVSVSTNAVPVNNGVFSVRLEFGNQFNGTDRWLEVAVRTNGSGEFTTLTNRQAVLPSPMSIYAGHAGMAGTALSASSIPANAIPAHSITTDKLATGAVGSAQLTAGALATPVAVASATQVVVPNTSYTATGAAPTAFQLPAAGNIGDVVQIAGTGTGGWVVQNYDPQVWTPRDSVRAWQVVASSADGILLVAAENGGQLYTSTDSGASWTARDSARPWLCVASSADGQTLVAGTQNGRLYTSTDAGLTWNPRDSARYWNSVACSADGKKMVAGVAYGGQLYTSTDFGATWIARDTVRPWIAVASSADGTKLAAAAYNDYLYTSTDSGVTWHPQVQDKVRYWTAVASSADGTMLVAAEAWGGKLWTSTDSGVTWNPHGDPHNWWSVASSEDGQRLMAAHRDGTDNASGSIFTSSDAGQTFTPRESIHKWTGLASSRDGVKMVAAASDNYLSTSGFEAAGGQGVTATLVCAGNGNWSLSSLLADNVYANSVYANAVYAQGVLLTSDRNAKEQFMPVSPDAVLAKVAGLPLTQWRYKTDRTGAQHIGPMAQDFRAAFQLGEDDKHISVVDEGGVALAAIQGLNEKVEDRGQKSDFRIQKLEAENAQLKARLERLERLLNAKNEGGQ